MERLEIRCDFDTQQAAENASQLARALAELRQQFSSAGESVDRTAGSIAGLGSTATNAGNSLSRMGNNTQQAGQQTASTTNQFNAFQQVINNTNNVVSQTNVTINNLAVAQQRAAEATGGLVADLQRLAGGYVGLQSVMMLVREINEQFTVAIEARNRLVGDKLNLDETIRPLLVNKGVEGPQAEARARTMVMGAAGRTLADPTQVVRGLAAGQAAGFNVDLDKGNSDVEEGIAYAKRANINSPEAFDGLMRLMATRKDRDGAKFSSAQFFAEIQAGFGTSAVQNADQYVANLIRASQGRSAAGGSWEQGLALYGGAIQVTKDPDIAGGVVDRISQVAQGRTPRALRELGAAGVKYGVTPGASTSRADSIASAEIARRPVDGYAPDKTEAELVDQINREQVTLDNLQRGVVDRDRKHDLRVSELRRRRVKEPRNRKSIDAEIGEADTEFQEQQQVAQQSITEATRRLAEKNQKLRDSIKGRLQQDDFMRLPQDQKEQVLLQLLRDSGDDPVIREMLLENGVADSRSLGYFTALGGKSGQAAMQTSRAAIASASGSKIRQDRDAYSRTEAGQAAAATIRTAKAGAEGTYSEDIFNAKLDEEADKYIQVREKDYEISTKRQMPATTMFSPIGIGQSDYIGTFTKGGKESYLRGRFLLEQMRDWWNTLSPAEQAAHPEILESFKAAEVDLYRGHSYRTDAAEDATIRSHYSDLRNAQATVARNRASRAASPGMSAGPPNLNGGSAATSSAAEDAAVTVGSSVGAAMGGATGSQAVTNYFVTTHIGNVFSRGADIVLPGRLER